MRWLILITYLIQFLEIVRFPVPSEFSTLRLVQTGQQPHWRHFGLGLLGILTFHLPLVFIIYPGVTIKMNALISPIFNPLPVSVVAPLLLAGSVLTMLGVRALRSRERMENPAAGNLTTTGIYRVCRHPINLGLMLIMTGFFGVYPFWIMVPGMVAFFYNLHTRSRWEEQRLMLLHGTAYTDYQRRVAMYGLRLKPK